MKGHSEQRGPHKRLQQFSWLKTWEERRDMEGTMGPLYGYSAQTLPRQGSWGKESLVCAALSPDRLRLGPL